MTIASKAELETAMQCRYSRLYSTKTPVNPGNAGTGFNISYWYQTAGFPAAGLAPTTTATALSNASTGAIPFMQQTSPRTSYLADLNASCPLAGHTVEIHDRLIQISSTAQTTAQTVTGFDLNSFLSTNNIGNRIGDANYSDVQWWVENNVNGVSTVITLTINVTYNDGTTGNLNGLTGYVNQRQSRMFALNNLIPAADSGKYIRAINTVTSSATITPNGIAFVATRYRASLYLEIANQIYNSGWTELGMPEIYNQSCLFPIIIAPAANISTVHLDGTIVYG
jgi:hypothetical protein